MHALNSGLTITALPKTVFPFGSVTGSQTLVLVQRLDVSQFTEASFLVRGHAISGVTGSTTLTFQVAWDAYNYEDGTQIMLQSGLPTGGTLPQLIWTPSTVAPTVSVLSVASGGSNPNPNFGRFLALQLIATVPSGSQGGSITVSVDLTMKGGDPGALALAPGAFRGYVPL